jgi:hypothetical protein
LLVLAGGVFCGLMWRSFSRARDMSHWPEVPCVILRSETDERRLGPAVATEFQFAVLFGYEWQGERFESDLLSLRGSPWQSEPQAAREWCASYPVGSQATCRVNPRHPATAVLRIDSRAPGYSLWFPAIFVVAGSGIIAGSFRRPGKVPKCEK